MGDDIEDMEAPRVEGATDEKGGVSQTLQTALGFGKFAFEATAQVLERLRQDVESGDEVASKIARTLRDGRDMGKLMYDEMRRRFERGS